MREKIASLIEAGHWLEADKLAQYQLLNRNDPSFCCWLISALEDEGELVKSLSGLEQLVQVFPQRTPFLLEHARLLVLNGFFEKAIKVWQKVIKISPDSSVAYFNLAKAYSEIGESIKSIALYEGLLRLVPDHENALFNLANLRQRSGYFELAISLYRRLLSCNPLFLDAWINIAKAYKSSAFYEQAEFCYRRALELEPSSVAAHWNLAHLLLGQERWQEGWVEYEWRLQRAEAFSPPALKEIPVWRGENLFDCRILLWVEQGAGDAIQFVRFVHLLPGPAKKNIIYCPPNLVRLLASAPGVNQVISYEHAPPVVDYQLSLLSLPNRLGLSTASAFSCPPYLRPPFVDGVMAVGVCEDSKKLKVGLVWSGNPNHANDAERSLAISDFAGLLKIRNISFFSLQVFVENKSTMQPVELPSCVSDLVPLLSDFADTAQCLAELDLLITVDTAVAHLAGALGFPAWVLLPKEPDWRWALERSDSLWYSSLRLFRQSRTGGWGPVIEQVEQELLDLIEVR